MIGHVKNGEKSFLPSCVIIMMPYENVLSFFSFQGQFNDPLSLPQEITENVICMEII